MEEWSLSVRGFILVDSQWKQRKQYLGWALKSVICLPSEGGSGEKSCVRLGKNISEDNRSKRKQESISCC